MDDTILVQITSTRHSLPGTEVLLDPAVETASNLHKVCVASCTNILTMDQDAFFHGRVNARDLRFRDDWL
jgi:hypothetical protein